MAELTQAGGRQLSAAYRWTVLLFVSLAMAGNYYVYDAINPITDILKDQLGFTDYWIGWLNSSYSVAAVATLLIAGVLIDRLGTKKATFVFAFLCFLGALLMVVKGSIWSMVLARFVLGLGAESMIVAVTTALAKWFRGKELGFAFGLNLTVARLASVAADNSPSWAPWAFDTWYEPLWIAVGFGVLCALAAGIYGLLEHRAEQAHALSKGGAVDKLVWRDIFIFPKSYWFIVGLCFTFYSAIFPFRLFAIKFFMERHEMSREMAGLTNSLIPLAAMVATPIFGLLVDKVGHRALFMAVASALLLPAFLMMAYATSAQQVTINLPFTPQDLVAPLPVLLATALMGFSFSLIPAVMWPSVAYLVEESRLGSAYALMTLIQQIGFFLMPQIVGWTNDAAGASAANPAGHIPGMWVFSVLGLVGLTFSFLLWRSERGKGLETIRA